MIISGISMFLWTPFHKKDYKMSRTTLSLFIYDWRSSWICTTFLFFMKWVGKWPFCRGKAPPFHRGTIKGDARIEFAYGDLPCSCSPPPFLKSPDLKMNIFYQQITRRQVNGCIQREVSLNRWRHVYTIFIGAATPKRRPSWGNAKWCQALDNFNLGSVAGLCIHSLAFASCIDFIRFHTIGVCQSQTAGAKII